MKRNLLLLLVVGAGIAAYLWYKNQINKATDAGTLMGITSAQQQILGF